MHPYQLVFRFSLALTLIAGALVPALAAGPTGLLNDTGQTECDDGSNFMQWCYSDNSGDAAPMPSQDARYGRDRAPLNKVGGGMAGFDFTKVCMDGTLNCTTAADTTSSPASTAWACTKDNVTNLIWSLNTMGRTSWNVASTGTYPDSGHNTANRCGFSTGWRLPTRRELASIVHLGAINLTIDTNYFPSTMNSWYWSSDTFAIDPGEAWVVRFDTGVLRTNCKPCFTSYVRLVRSGP